MVQLNQLAKAERREVCRGMARCVYDCLDVHHRATAVGATIGGPFQARVYKACSELGLIEENEFSGNSFSPERVAVLADFEKIFAEATVLAEKYTKLIEPLCQQQPDFAMSADALQRMFCVSRFSARLHEDGPFSNLNVTLCLIVDDDDRDSEENDENDESDEDGDGDNDDDDDSIVCSTEDEDEDEDEDDSDSDSDTDGVNGKKTMATSNAVDIASKVASDLDDEEIASKVASALDDEDNAPVWSLGALSGCPKRKRAP